MQTIYRTYSKLWTVGRFPMPDGQELRTLERPWLNNQPNISCIPEGIYTVDRDTTGKWKYYRLRNEEIYPRTDIELHPATLVRHLQGCIAPCMAISGGTNGREPVAMDGLLAMDVLLKWFGDNSWVLRIVEDK